MLRYSPSPRRRYRGQADTSVFTAFPRTDHRLPTAYFHANVTLKSVIFQWNKKPPTVKATDDSLVLLRHSTNRKAGETPFTAKNRAVHGGFTRATYTAA